MKNPQVPGQEIATSRGYSLHATSGHDGSILSATFTRPDGVALTITRNSAGGFEAEVFGVHRMIRLTSGRIGWPHPRLHIFENEILALLRGVEDRSTAGVY